MENDTFNYDIAFGISMFLLFYPEDQGLSKKD